MQQDQISWVMGTLDQSASGGLGSGFRGLGVLGFSLEFRA